MFKFLKDKIQKIYSTFTSKAQTLFSRTTIDEEFFKELEILLISSDTGVATTKHIISELKSAVQGNTIQTVEELKKRLHALLLEHLGTFEPPQTIPQVIVLAGINGTGKTTCAAKLAHLLKTEHGKRVLLVAGDTFRAAATRQLQEWGESINVPVFVGNEQQDPASVIFDACEEFKSGQYDHLIVDTAGRLQTKTNLMRELEKIHRIINKQLPREDKGTWLTIDAMLGQNSLSQARIFHEVTHLDGIILTKMDGTGKAGIVFSITKELKLPIVYVTFGESIDDIAPFNPHEYVNKILDM